MRDKALIIIGLLVLIPGLAGCGGQSFPAVIPVSAAGLADLELVPYTDEYLGLRGIMPDGWVEAYPGVWPGVFLSAGAGAALQELDAGAGRRDKLSADPFRADRVQGAGMKRSAQVRAVRLRAGRLVALVGVDQRGQDGVAVLVQREVIVQRAAVDKDHSLARPDADPGDR